MRIITLLVSQPPRLQKWTSHQWTTGGTTTHQSICCHALRVRFRGQPKSTMVSNFGHPNNLVFKVVYIYIYDIYIRILFEVMDMGLGWLSLDSRSEFGMERCSPLALDLLRIGSYRKVLISFATSYTSYRGQFNEA